MTLCQNLNAIIYDTEKLTRIKSKLDKVFIKYGNLMKQADKKFV